jgi:hypothetical protein
VADLGTGRRNTPLDSNALERRQQSRYGLSLQANFVWTDAEGVDHVGQGITRDIASKGMFIYTESPPPPGCDLHIDVVLSAGDFEVFPFPVFMKASALVLRVEPTQTVGLQGGFAIANKKYELLRGEPVAKNDWN